MLGSICSGWPLMPTPRLGAARDQVHPALLQLLDNFATAAAYVLNPAYEILATNQIAQALLAPFGMTNMLRMMFEHPPGSRTDRADLPDLRCAGRARSAAARRHGGARQPQCRRVGPAGVTLNFLGARTQEVAAFCRMRGSRKLSVAIGPPRQHRSRRC
jgi:hypothetical protein